MSKDRDREPNAASPLRRALGGGALVFSLGLGIGSLAGSMSDTPARAGGPAEDGTDSHRASPPVPAAGERQPEVPLFFVTFDSDGPGDRDAGNGLDGSRVRTLLADGEPWML